MVRTDKYIDINGERFYRINPDTKEAEKIINLDYGYNDIFGAYDRPSQRKINIWEYWEKWANENDFTMWICSRNTSKFCIGFSGFLDGHRIYGYITDTYNKVVII